MVSPKFHGSGKNAWRGMGLVWTRWLPVIFLKLQNHLEPQLTRRRELKSRNTLVSHGTIVSYQLRSRLWVPGETRQTRDFLSSLGTRLRRVKDNRAAAFLRQRISTVIQRGNAISIAGSIPGGWNMNDELSRSFRYKYITCNILITKASTEPLQNSSFLFFVSFVFPLFFLSSFLFSSFHCLRLILIILSC